MAQKIGPAATALIKQYEGLRINAYPDPATGGAPWTIGYGHTGPEVRRGLTWTQAQADEAFVKDIARFENVVNAMIGSAPTTAAQFGALVSFAYNLGPQNLATSTLLKMHKAGNYDGAAMQFLSWDKAAGKVMAGLTRRRQAEARLYQGLS